MAGISPTTLAEWLRRGRDLDGRPSTPIYISLVEDVEQAQAAAEVYALASIRKAMARDWRAAAWWLENRSPGWRRRKERPASDLRHAPKPVGQVIEDYHLSAEDMQRITTERIRAEHGRPADGPDEGTRARRARLVSSSA